MTNRYPNITFFSKLGDSIPVAFNSDKGYYDGSITLKEVSVGLIENETIYMVEKLLDNTSQVVYGVPHIDLTASSNSVLTKLERNDKGFKLFTMDSPFQTNPQISFVDSIQSAFIQDLGDVLDIPSGLIQTNLNVNKALRIDFCLTSEEDGEWETNLIIQDEIGIIAVFNVYGETIGEDERFSALLADFGELISDKDEFIFRESNIDEDLPNWKILNAKRKEFLVEINQIKPYYSTYRGILGILFLFGYHDLRLKEYWWDSVSGKYYFEEIKLDELSKLDDPENYKGLHLQKTSYFGLFYDLNKPTGELDDEGLPAMERNFPFSNEEIIIKLFGLRNYIKSRNIGGITQIIDIVGEATYFNKFTINTWIDRSKMFHIDDTINIGFDIDKKDGFIEDVRPIVYDYTSCPIGADDPLINLQLGDMYSCFLGHFANFYQENPQYLDEAGIPVGCPIKLSDKSFILPWNQISTTWNQTNLAPLSYTWNNIVFGDFYDSEWIIEKISNADDIRTFKESFRKPVGNNQILTTILPYTGQYNVTLKLYGYNGRFLQFTRKKAITVRMKEADHMSFFRHVEPKLQIWKDNPLKWNEINSEWNSYIFDNRKYQMKLAEVQFETFNITNYFSINYLNDKNLGFKANTWRDFPDTTWKDYSFITWRNLEYTGELLGKAIIDEITAGGEIQIGEDVFTLANDYNINEFYRLANELAGLSPILFPEFNRFNYIYREISNVKFVEVISKDHGRDGVQYFGSSGGVTIRSFNYQNPTWNDLIDENWNQIPITWNNAINLCKSRYLDNAFTMDNMRLYADEFHATVLVPIFFSFDNSKIAGKTKARWKIYKEDGTMIMDVINPVLVYKFNEVGNYSVEVEIEDSNGNKNSIKKNKIIHIITPHEFEVLKEFNKVI